MTPVPHWSNSVFGPTGRLLLGFASPGEKETNCDGGNCPVMSIGNNHTTDRTLLHWCDCTSFTWQQSRHDSIQVTKNTQYAWERFLPSRVRPCTGTDGMLGLCLRVSALTSICKNGNSYLVDPASSHMLVSKIKPCMSKYKQHYTVKLRMAH